ncbi:MAG: menaquinone biosynthesis protein [bacterium]
MKNNHKISLGLINFTNCLPINYTLEKWALENIILSWGHPVLINRLIYDGQLYVAPVSAFEYIKNENDYVLIKEACITSDAECGSVILFSNHKLEDLAGKKIGIPHNSATSINMLKIILNEKGILSDTTNQINFVEHKYKKPLKEALEEEFDAVLYIGDQALISRIKHNSTLLQYDLGKLWKELTGLPPVFGTWVARADWAVTHKDDFDRIKFLINKAVEAGLGMYFNDVIQKASSELDLPDYVIKDYLTDKIKYNFTPEHEKSLNLFKKLYNKLNDHSEAISYL